MSTSNLISNDGISELSDLTLRNLNIKTITSPSEINVKTFGVKADGSDDLLTIQSAIDYANTNGIKSVYFPSGTYVVSDTLYFGGTETKYYGDGDSSVIKLVRGSEQQWAVPLIVVPTTSVFNTIEGLNINHNAALLPQTSTALPGGVYVGYLSAIVVKADNCKVLNTSIYNAWDNSIAVFGCVVSGNGSPTSPFSLVQVPGTPENVLIDSCYAENSGCGEHILDSGTGKAGGMNNLSGKNVTFSNCVAQSCYTGFILDYGAGASGNFINCRANNTLDDGKGVGAGRGFYIGSADSRFINCTTAFAGTTGWFIDGYSNYNSFINCSAYDSIEEGFRIASPNITMIGCIARANSRDNIGVYSGFKFVTFEDVHYKLYGCVSEGYSLQKYGLEEESSGGFKIYGEIYGCRFLNNTSGDVSLEPTSVYLKNENGHLNVEGSAHIINTSSVSGSRIIGDSLNSTTSAFGDFGGNGQLFIGSATNLEKRIAVGYDTINDYSVIQSIEAGVSTKPLYINPSGGNVVVGANLNVVGALSKTTGSFVIDHPDPVKKEKGYKLKHCFVESNTRGDNLYRYKTFVDVGVHRIKQPDYFKYLNENSQVFVTPADNYGAGFGYVCRNGCIHLSVNLKGTYNILVIATRKDKAAKDYFDGKGGAEYIPKEGSDGEKTYEDVFDMEDLSFEF